MTDAGCNEYVGDESQPHIMSIHENSEWYEMQLDYDKQETSIQCKTQIRRERGEVLLEQERELVEGRRKCGI